MAATFYKETLIVSVAVGTKTVSKIIRVREEVASSEGGDLVRPLLVANTVGPIGVSDTHKWWEIPVELDQDDQETIFATSYISPTTAGVTTLGASTGFTLVITEKNSAGQTRTITYTNTHIKRRAADTENMKPDYQPRALVFLSYGTRTVTSWS